MKRVYQFIRLMQINVILLRNQIDTVVLSTKTLQPFFFLRFFNPWHWIKKNDKPRGEILRVTLEELGPLFVKFGQILSTRRDILPQDIADELEKLQDRVPPFPGELAKKMLEDVYKKPIGDIFASFNEVPLASASIAQVHAATLKDGRLAVVKILRPNIEKIIPRDIGLLYSAAALAEKALSYGRKLRLREVVAEFERALHYELDLMHEAANASLLRRNFQDSELLYVPQVFWEYTSQRILVMERIEGIAVSDLTKLKEQGINLARLAEHGVKLFFTQVLRDSFFHADMHPGNIFVNQARPELAQYIAVDFGIMGTLSPTDQRYIAENLLAFFRRDYRRVAELHIKAGRIPSTVRVDEFETAIRGLCEPIFERPLKNISFGNVLVKMFQAASEFQMEIQPQFFLLQKTLLNIEGLGRQLYPDLDLWTTAKPLLEKWIRQQMGPRAIAKKLYKSLPDTIDALIELPHLSHQYMHKAVIEQRRPLAFPKAKWRGLGGGIMTVGLINLLLIYSLASSHLVLVNSIIVFVGMLCLVYQLSR